MKKSQIKEKTGYYDRYIALAHDIELTDAFDESIEQLRALDMDTLKKLDGKKYSPEKWSVNDIFQHLIDSERIFTYRSLLFAREEGKPAPGYDQDDYAKAAMADKRKIEDLVNELITLRQTTKMMFDSFDDETLMKKGKSWDYVVSILAIGFTILGHQIHHLKVIEEKYFPLLN